MRAAAAGEAEVLQVSEEGESLQIAGRVIARGYLALGGIGKVAAIFPGLE